MVYKRVQVMAILLGWMMVKKSDQLMVYEKVPMWVMWLDYLMVTEKVTMLEMTKLGWMMAMSLV